MNKFTTGLEFTSANDPYGFSLPNELGVFKVVDGVVFSQYMSELMETVVEEVETCCTDKHCHCHDEAFDYKYRDTFEDGIEDINSTVVNIENITAKIEEIVYASKTGEMDNIKGLLMSLETQLTNIKKSTQDMYVLL